MIEKTGFIYETPIIRLQIVRDSTITTMHTVRSPYDIGKILLERYQYCDREIMVVVHLDTKNNVLAIEPVAQGGLNSASIRIADIFKGAILGNAASIILAHNHPSGDYTPSPEDIEVTREIKKAGKLLDIQVLDHIVIGFDKFHSMADHDQI